MPATDWRGRIESWRNPRSLGARLVLILTMVGVGAALAITLLLATIITPSFNQLETKAVDAQVERTHAALAEYGSKLESAVRDYGDWKRQLRLYGASHAHIRA